MELQHRDRIVRVKIVYYGPAVGGKTTNLRVLHAAAGGDHRGDLVSVNSAQDRTILFDLLPLKGVGFHGFEIRFQIVAVPGQAAYSATRRMALRGADAIIFVANSASDRFHDNSLSFKEMTENLIAHGLDPATIPLVFQYNKRDLPETSSIEELEGTLNFRRAPHFPAVAFRGDGVLETLGAILEQTMVELTGRYRSLTLGAGETVQAWTWESLTRIFGRTTLGPARADTPSGGVATAGAAASGDEPGASEALEANRESAAQLEAEWLPDLPPQPPPRHVVRVPLAGEVGGGAPLRSDTRPEDVLIDSYARASVALGQSLDEVREERDQARRRLADVGLAFGAVEGLASGKPASEALKPVLARLLRTAGSRRGSLLVPGPGGAPHRLAGAGLAEDPLAVSRAGQRLLARELAVLEAPQVLASSDSDDLREAIRGLEPTIVSLVALPLRSGAGLHGLLLLYYGATDPLPSDDALVHLDRLARGLASGFLLSRIRGEAAPVQREAAKTTQGEAARRMLPELRKVLEAVGQQLRALSRRPGGGGLGLDYAAQAVERALALAEAVSDLSAQTLVRQAVTVDAIFAGLVTPGLRPQPAPGLRVQADAALLRIAVDALAELAGGGGARPPVLRAGTDERQVRILAEASGLMPATPANDVRLALVRQIATLHGGTLRVGVNSGRPAYVLLLPRA